MGIPEWKNRLECAIPVGAAFGLGCHTGLSRTPRRFRPVGPWPLHMGLLATTTTLLGIAALNLTPLKK